VTTFDEGKVIAAANDIAERLFASYDVNGTVLSVNPVDGKVTVTVQIVDGSKTVKGVGTVRTERAS
jgi:TolB-like protein